MADTLEQGLGLYNYETFFIVPRYAAFVGSWLPTIRDKMIVPSSSIKHIQQAHTATV